ncbi:MAG: PIG-L family deacetylase [Burkholderiaceae bacterium]|nr:PIG-L family deacetylase [Microbacteriaceae bacterium]
MRRPSNDSDAATDPERILFVHAHPDDESIATGGTIATLLDRGASVTVLTCTRGEQGEIIPHDLQHLSGHPLALAAHRESELAAAMSAVGVTDHRWLGAPGARMTGAAPRRYADSGMVWGESGPEPLPVLAPDALFSADVGEVAADIATVIATTGATAVVSYDDRGGYGHPDHIAAHHAARRAAEVMSVPFYTIDAPDAAPGGTVVDVTAVLDRKTRALAAHRSQLTIEGERMLQPGGQYVPITTVESYHRLGTQRPDPRAGVEFADRTFGGRAIPVAVALIGGVAVGAITTVSHTVTLTVAGVTVPTGLILGLAAIAAVIVGLRVLYDNRIVAGAASVGILGMIALLSLESAGGSVLIPATDTVGYFIYGPVLIAGLVLAWPKIVQPTRDKIAPLSDPKGPSVP